MPAALTLSALYLYPLKSCAGIALQQAWAGPRGLMADRVLDRSWMLADADGRMLTQRELPALARLTTRLLRDASGEAHGVIVDAAGQPSLVLDDQMLAGPDQADARCTVELHGRRVPARRTRAAASAWFTAVLGGPARLMYQGEDELRAIAAGYSNSMHAAQVSFADGFQYLLTSDSTLAALNRELGQAIPMNRFRPNLVVTGGAADAEYGWREVGIGEARFALVKPCQRCVVTTIDQWSGTLTGKEPLATLSRTHFLRQDVPDGRIQGPIFGENAVPLQSGVLRVGMPVDILQRGAPRAFRT